MLVVDNELCIRAGAEKARGHSIIAFRFAALFPVACALCSWNPVGVPPVPSSSGPRTLIEESLRKRLIANAWRRILSLPKSRRFYLAKRVPEILPV